jgi:hypothetical protein
MHLAAIGLATAIALTGSVALAQRGAGTAGGNAVAGAPAAMLVVRASDRIPSFHAERACKAVKEDGDEAYKDCLSDEKRARQQLEPIWSSYSASRRAECISETIGLKANSYADLIFCLQLRADSSSKGATKPPN